MDWYLLAGASPLLFALTNHIDKTLLSNYFAEHGVGALLIFSALASFLALPLFLLFGESLDQPDLLQTGVIIISAILNVVLLWCYLSAMDEDEPSIVVIFYQLVPVFGVVFPVSDCETDRPNCLRRISGSS